MKYIKVIWKHEFTDEPVELYSELDDWNNEIRKVEVYRNGEVGYATLDLSYSNTFLSKYELPDIIEINQDKQFCATSISKDDFEIIWDNATSKKLRCLKSI